MSLYLTKHSPVVRGDIADQVQACVKFSPASELELKALGDDIPDGYVAGWASTPDLDLYRHVVEFGAFKESISTRGIAGPKGIKFLTNHDWEKVAGVIKVLEYRGDKLWIEAQFNLSISYAKDAYEACKMNGGLNFSVGFMLEDYSFKKDNNDREYLHITKGDLFEVSCVPFPGNEDAVMTYVKGREAASAPKTLAEFEKSLVAKGLVKGRNEAHTVTLAVKYAIENCLTLFKPDSSLEDDAGKTTNGPLLDVHQLNEVSDLVAKMKAILTPAS